MVNPFDLRTILLAKHAQHVVLIHFPIALFITGVGLDLLSRGKCNSQLASPAYLNLSIAAATVLPAVVTGLLAWQYALDGKRLKGLLLLHLIAALSAALLVVASWWMHWRSSKAELALLVPHSSSAVWSDCRLIDKSAGCIRAEILRRNSGNGLDFRCAVGMGCNDLESLRSAQRSVASRAPATNRPNSNPARSIFSTPKAARHRHSRV